MQDPISKRIVRYGLALLIGGILFVSLLLVINSVTASQERGSTGEIEELELVLQSNKLSPADRSVVIAKLAIARSEATQNAMPKPDSNLLRSQKQTALAQNTQVPAIDKQDRPTGLITDPPKGDITRNAVITTIWIQKMNDGYYQICAGHLANDKNQGVVYLLIETPRKLIEFLAPSKSGNLTITGKEGDMVIISSQSGQILYFDLKNKKLLDSTELNWNHNRLTHRPESTITILH
jgi:hypothetical protein